MYYYFSSQCVVLSKNSTETSEVCFVYKMMCSKHESGETAILNTIIYWSTGRFIV